MSFTRSLLRSLHSGDRHPRLPPACDVSQRLPRLLSPRPKALTCLHSRRHACQGVGQVVSTKAVPSLRFVNSVVTVAHARQAVLDEQNAAIGAAVREIVERDFKSTKAPAGGSAWRHSGIARRLLSKGVGNKLLTGLARYGQSVDALGRAGERRRATMGIAARLSRARSCRPTIRTDQRRSTRWGVIRGAMPAGSPRQQWATVALAVEREDARAALEHIGLRGGVAALARTSAGAGVFYGLGSQWFRRVGGLKKKISQRLTTPTWAYQLAGLVDPRTGHGPRRQEQRRWREVIPSHDRHHDRTSSPASTSARRDTNTHERCAISSVTLDGEDRRRRLRAALASSKRAGCSRMPGPNLAGLLRRSAVRCEHAYLQALWLPNRRKRQRRGVRDDRRMVRAHGSASTARRRRRSPVADAVAEFSKLDDAPQSRCSRESYGGSMIDWIEYRCESCSSKGYHDPIIAARLS